MKNEIRDLQSFDYWNSECDCVLSVYRDDQGIHIVNADMETDWAYHWVITPEGTVKNFKVTTSISFGDENRPE